MTDATLPPLVCDGTFIVLTATDAQVHMLEPTSLTAYWEGWTIADTRSRREESLTYLVRQFFGRAAEVALPAPHAEALLWYVEHYEGRHQNLVRQLAACIYTGRLNEGNPDDGYRVPLTPPSPAPLSPAPALFPESQEVAA